MGTKENEFLLMFNFSGCIFGNKIKKWEDKFFFKDEKNKITTTAL